MNLKIRHKIERQFHDNWAKSVNIKTLFYLEAFTSPTAIENLAAIKYLKPLKNKKILDLGCGLGDASVYFAKKGAHVYSIDISPQMIQVTKKLARMHHVGRQIKSSVMVAEKLRFPNNYFDYIYGNGVLHHVDINKASQEIHRTLKPKGRAFFIEPLPYNPLVNFYRYLAKSVRTTAETPLYISDINSLSTVFNKINVQGFHLFTLAIFLYYFFIERISPNRERYWKKILLDGQRLSVPFYFLNQLDRLLLSIFPSSKWLFWNIGISIQK